MAERRRKKQKQEAMPTEPSKDEMKIAKHVRFNTPKKMTVFQKQNLEYFVGSKAVDTLMKSKWAKATKKSEPMFRTRGDAVSFMEQLLQNSMFYRVQKVLKESKSAKDDQKSKSTKSIVEESKSSEVKKRKKAKDSDKGDAAKPGEATEEKKKKKKKYRLDVHEEQVFLDSSDLYVWVYDPLSPKKILLGGIVVLGIIGATLFPLWPPTVRIGVYYLSICGGIFVGSILCLALCRSLLFALIWVSTMGKHHVWFFPNLLADVGFFDSFKPLYTHDVKTSGNDKEKEKNSDSEGENDDATSPSGGVEELEKDDTAKSELSDELLKEDDNESTAKTSDDDRASVEQCNDDKGSSSDYEMIDGTVDGVTS